MTALDDLLHTLLYEGYALYPYTPGAAKNATPTPFGIVYPPVYAAENPAASDHLQLECLLAGDPSGLRAELFFLQPRGERHQAVERWFELASPGETEFDLDGLSGGLSLELEGRRVRLRVENTTLVPPGLGRAAALEHALVSAHPVLRAEGARFVSPLEAEGCENVNTWPVLATAEDDAIVGAAIVLPDHPQLAPQSRGDLFDATEIEEALLLHVHALSDAERDEICRQDPAVREMIARAAATSPEDILALHGTMQPVGADPRDGEREATVDGVTFRRGTRVVLHPEPGADPSDFLMAGRTATVERIYVDYDGKAYLGVTVDDDPMRELMRDTGRYQFFFANEVEVVTG
jgi:hypothetical protein